MAYAAFELQFGQQRRPLVFIGPDADLVKRQADDVFGAITGQAAEAVVHLHIAAGVAFGDGNRVGTGMKGLGEFFFAGLQRSLGPLLLGNVAQGGDDARLVADLDQPAGNYAGQGLAAFVVRDDGHVVQCLVANHLFDALQALARLVPQTDLFGAHVDHFGGRPAKGLGERGVDLDKHTAVQAGDADRVWAGLEQAGEFFFGGAQALFALDLVGDVQQGAGHAQRRASLVAVQARAAFQVARAAVFQWYAVSQLIVAGWAFAQGAIGITHILALFLGHTLEKRFERFMERLGRQAV